MRTTLLVVVVLVLAIAAKSTLSTSTTEQWMKLALGDIGNHTLQQLTLPGTHDSASYSVTDELVDVPPFLAEIVKISDLLDIPVGQLIDDWAKSQESNVLDQLLNGIRYLDLRVTWDASSSSWKTHHGPVVGTTVQDVLQQIQQFLSSHSSEVLVLEMSHNVTSSTPAQNQLLLQFIQSYIGKYLWPPQSGFQPINKMIQSGQNVILTLTFDTLPSNIWTASTIINSYANSPDLPTMESYNQGQVVSWQSHGIYPNQLYKISWTLTADADTILEMILPDYPKSLIELANTANSQLNSWFNSTIDTKNFKYPYLSNIMIIDNFATSPIVDIVQRGLLQ